MNGQAGKGSKRRPCNEKKVSENGPYADIKIKVLPRDSKGNIVWE